MDKKLSISDAELEIVNILWQAEVPISAYEIRQRLNEQNQWERTTVLTLIRRLVEKGVLKQEKREIYYYSTNISKEEYVQRETKQFIQKMYQGKSKDLIAALFQQENLTLGDIEELKTYFHTKGNSHGS